MRLFPRIIWHAGVVMAVVAAVAIPLIVGYWVVRRFVLDDATAVAEYPEFFLADLAYLMLAWLALVPWCRKSVRIWRDRKNLEAIAYRAGVAGIADSGSRTGNVLAKILLIPFVLLGIGMIVMMIVGMLSI